MGKINLENNSYFVIDRARTGSYMDDVYEFNLSISCLYKGRSEENLADYAPYLIEITDEPIALEWILKKSNNDHWGIFISTKLKFEKLYRHLRKFLIVQDENDEELYFRFYDPRVLRMFIPTCDRAQLSEFFGEIDYFITQDEDPDFALKFSLVQGTLSIEKINYADLSSISEDVEISNQNNDYDFNNDLDSQLV
jgi:hypothetical protein